MGQFSVTAEGIGRYRQQTVARVVFGTMTACLVIPLVGIIGMMLVRGAPALSFSFLFDFPTNGMTAGGIFPAIVGTLWLVVDDSLSMGHADAQMTPTERLHWADALGLLPAGAKPGKLNRHIAELTALRADLAYLESRSQLPAPWPDCRRARAWSKSVRGAINWRYSRSV